MQLNVDPQYTIDMVKFIDNIIYYSMINISDIEKIGQEVSSASLDRTNIEFAQNYTKIVILLYLK